MKKLLSLLGLTFMMAFTLTGCELYFGKDKDNAGGGDGDRPPGWACDADAECAAGCYCDGATEGKQGECAEAGFCDSNADCPAGFKCDDRSSCVPADTCESDTDCDAGAICTDGVCETTCVCETDAQAQAAGYGYCDEARKTCENTGSFTCGGIPTCGTEPTCPEGAVGMIDPTTGCWNGQCGAIWGCDVTPTCESFQYESDCRNPSYGNCGVSYTGINCTTPTGASCTTPGAGCTCESYTFAACHSPAN